MRRVLAILAIMTGLLALAIAFGAGARAATLPDCLASKHVCVSSDARGLVSPDLQARLEQQIGGSDIYLVVAPAGASGYDSSMRQLISDLGARHDQFVVGFLDTGRLHFGAYNRGSLPPAARRASPPASSRSIRRTRTSPARCRTSSARSSSRPDRRARQPGPPPAARPPG